MKLIVFKKSYKTDENIQTEKLPGVNSAMG